MTEPPARAPARLALALDVGGTFTDVILADMTGGRFWVTKSPSVPQDPSEGFFGGVEKILLQAGVAPADIAVTLHGSTVATNAILEGKGAPVSLVTTKGFRHVLEIGRADIPRHENLFGWVKPKRPVPARHIHEVGERTLVDGTIALALDEGDVARAAAAIRRAGHKAVGVVLLHAYANAAHERRIGELLARELPGVEISLSSDVLAIFREYERTLATVFNATVQPIAGRYVGKLTDGLARRGIAAPFFIMKSNGGVFPPSEAARQPVHLALSGPAAGARGAAHVGRIAGLPDLVTIDMGGTSADVALIRGGEPEMTAAGRVGAFPLALPMIDIHTIGAGGGSVAHIDQTGALRVGPESAGADPGPAAYGKGGRRPTVTDANLVLGRIPPHLLDGEIPLHVKYARTAILEGVARPLGLSVEVAARGIVEIVDNNMVGALKVMSVERGLAPGDFTLCAFGGAGPVHGARLMRLLGSPRMLVPRFPGILCAMGLIATDLKYEFQVTRLQRAPDFDIAAIADTFRALATDADTRLAGDGVAPERRSMQRFADVRYAKQGVELAVPVPDGPITSALAASIAESFHALHERLYSFADRRTPIEIVNLRVSATGRMDRIALPEIRRVATGTLATPDGSRPAAPEGGTLAPTPIYRREKLLAGHVVPGPAIVDQLDSTTVVLAGQIATTDAHGNLIVEEGAR